MNNVKKNKWIIANKANGKTGVINRHTLLLTSLLIVCIVFAGAIYAQYKDANPKANEENKHCASTPGGALDSDWLCDTNNDGKNDACYLCATPDSNVNNTCYQCASTDYSGPNSCYQCYKNPGDPKPNSCYLCDVTDDSIKDVCFYLDDTDGDGTKDSCYHCDNNNNGFPDSVYICDPNDKGVYTSCFKCDNDADGRKDTCYYPCDRDNDGKKDSCYQCASVAEGPVNTCRTWTPMSSQAQLDACINKRQKKVNGQDYVAPVNGCGGDGGASFPDDPSFGAHNTFKACCDAHDTGYGTCGSKKDTVDANFRACMKARCTASYNSGNIGYLLYLQCNTMAETYYQAVHNVGGDFWLAGQFDSCECGDCYKGS